MNNSTDLAVIAGVGALGAMLGYMLAAKQFGGRRVLLDDRNKPGGSGYVYNRSQVHGNIVYASGQVAIQLLTGGKKGGTIKEETRLTLENMKELLEDSGSSLGNVLKTTCYLGSIDDYAAFNEVYSEFFSDNATKPARVCFAAGDLPLGAKVEVECTAFI